MNCCVLNTNFDIKGMIMEKDIADGNIGTIGKYDLEFKGGFLQVKVTAAPGLGIEADLVVKVSSDALLDAIAKAIPGQVDDAIISVLKTALKL